MAWKPTDIEAVERFQKLHNEKRLRSLFDYRSQMKTLAPQLLRIMLDGLSARGAFGDINDPKNNVVEMEDGPRAPEA